MRLHPFQLLSLSLVPLITLSEAIILPPYLGTVNLKGSLGFALRPKGSYADSPALSITKSEKGVGGGIIGTCCLGKLNILGKNLYTFGSFKGEIVQKGSGSGWGSKHKGWGYGHHHSQGGDDKGEEGRKFPKPVFQEFIGKGPLVIGSNKGSTSTRSHGFGSVRGNHDENNNNPPEEYQHQGEGERYPGGNEGGNEGSPPEKGSLNDISDISDIYKGLTEGRSRPYETTNNIDDDNKDTNTKGHSFDPSQEYGNNEEHEIKETSKGKGPPSYPFYDEGPPEGKGLSFFPYSTLTKHTNNNNAPDHDNDGGIQVIDHHHHQGDTYNNDFHSEGSPGPFENSEDLVEYHSPSHSFKIKRTPPPFSHSKNSPAGDPFALENGNGNSKGPFQGPPSQADHGPNGYQSNRASSHVPNFKPIPMIPQRMGLPDQGQSQWVPVKGHRHGHGHHGLHHHHLQPKQHKKKPELRKKENVYHKKDLKFRVYEYGENEVILIDDLTGHKDMIRAHVFSKDGEKLLRTIEIDSKDKKEEGTSKTAEAQKRSDVNVIEKEKEEDKKESKT